MLPTTPAAIVHRLAREPSAKATLFGQILRFLPKTLKASNAHAKVAFRHGISPKTRLRRAAFVVYGQGRVVVHVRRGTTLGIRPGSWIAVGLRHGITDQDRALVVLHVLRAVHGSVATLPVGTRLLAHVEAAQGERVQFSVSSAVLPDGVTVPLMGAAFDRRFHLGLSGFVVGGRRASALVAFGRSLVQSAGMALSAMSAQGSIASEAVGAAGQNTLGAVTHWRVPRRIVFIPAQRAYVQTQKGS